MPKDEMKWLQGKCCSGYPNCIHNPNLESRPAQTEGWIYKTKLMQLIEYGFPRGVGHTTAELNGVCNIENSVLIVSDYQQARNLKLPQGKFITLSEIPEHLRGLRKPIVIDHYALSTLVYDFIRQLLAKRNEKRLDKEKLSAQIQLRYHKLMYPQYSESDAKIVADVLASAICEHEEELR